MANYADGDGNGNSIAFDHEGKQVAVGAKTPHTASPGVEELVVAEIDVSALRAGRETARGRLLLAQPPAPEVCEIARAPAFTRQNVFDRVGGAVY